MANADQRFEEFRRDFIAHLSARFALAPDAVAARLHAWLPDPGCDEGPRVTEITSVRRLRIRR